MGARDRYTDIDQNQDNNDTGIDKSTADTGPVCPRYKNKPNKKACVHYRKGGTCHLIEAFLCVEFMRAKNYDDDKIRNACLDIAQVPATTGARAEAEARNETRKADGSFNGADALAEANTSGKIHAIIKATEQDIAELEAINFKATIESPGFDDIHIVNKYRPDGTRQLTIRHAAVIAAVTFAFPGARVSQLVIQPQPDKRKRKNKGK